MLTNKNDQSYLMINKKNPNRKNSKEKTVLKLIKWKYSPKYLMVYFN